MCGKPFADDQSPGAYRSAFLGFDNRPPAQPAEQQQDCQTDDPVADKYQYQADQRVQQKRAAVRLP